MADDLPTLPELLDEINSRGMEPDFAASAIRQWRNEARPLVANAADNQDDRWAFVDELDNRVDAAISGQRERAANTWAQARFSDPADLQSFRSAYDQSQGDPTRIVKYKTDDGTTVNLDQGTAERYQRLADELNKIATHSAFDSTREARDMTGKVTVGDTTLARYTTRIAGDKTEVVMTPDQADAKPLAFDIPTPTKDELQSEIDSQKKKLEALQADSEQAFTQGDLQADPTQLQRSKELDAKAEETSAYLRELSGKSGMMTLLHQRIREKTQTPEFAAIGDSTWGAAFQDLGKGLQNATFSAAGLVSRVLPRTMEHALEGTGALPNTGTTNTESDRALRFFAEAQGQQDTAYPGTTRNNLVGGFVNEVAQGWRKAAGEMLPYLGAGLASKVIAGTEGKVAMEALKAAGVVPMGATGAGMGASMAGGSYLESMRRIADAENSGDKETADRIRRGMDAHAILTGAFGATVSKLSPLHNLELSGQGLRSMGFDILKQGAEMPLLGVVQRSIIDPATLGDHPAVFEPISQEFGVGIAIAFPLAAGSYIIEKLGARKGQITGETKRAKDLAAEAGADDAATMEAIDQAHQIKIAAADSEASKEAKAVVERVQEIDRKLIAIEKDGTLDDVAKKDAREPLIKEKLDIFVPVAKAQEPAPDAPSNAPTDNPAPEQPAIEMPSMLTPDSGVEGKGKPLMPDSPMGGKDILDFVNEMQIGPPRSAAGQGADLDWKEQRSVPPFYQHRLFAKDGLNGINEVAQAAFNNGLISEATPDALMGKIFEAIDARKQFRTNQKIETQRLREGEAKMIDFDQEQAKLEAKPSATEVHISELNKGDVVTVGGDPMEVVSVKFDEDGVAQETTVRSERFGDITLDQNNRPTMMADAPVERAKINTDFLGEEDFTSDQPPASLSAIDQSEQGSQSPPPRGQADSGQQSASDSSGDSTTKQGPKASIESPEARSIKNAQIDQWRAERGLPEMAKAAKKSQGPMWDRANDELDKKPFAGADLAQDLVNNPRSHEDEEAALLLAHFMRQENAMAEAADDIAKLDPESNDFKRAVKRKDDALAQIEMAHLALRMSGTGWGRAGAARKMMIDRSDVPHVGATMADRKLALGRDLTESERADVESLHSDLTEAKKGVDAVEAEIESDQLQADNASAVDQIADEILKLSSDPEGRKKIGQKAREKLRLRYDAAKKILHEKGIIGGKTTNAMGLGGDLDAEAIKAMIDVAIYYIVEAGGVVADAVTKFSKDFAHVAKDQIQSIFDTAEKANARLETKLAEIAKSNAAKDKRKTPAQIVEKAKYLLDANEDVDPSVVRALHRAHIEDGVKTEADVTGRVADSLAEIYGREFTPDEVRRIHTQYGKVAKLPTDEVSIIQRDIKRQQLLSVKIEALKNKEPLLATGAEREKNSHEVHVLQQELEAIKRSTNYRKTGAGQLSGLQDRIAARLDTLIADTKDQILGNKPVRASRTSTEYDADNISRLNQLKALRTELRARRSSELADVADKTAIDAARATKAEFERKLAAREWEHAQDPKRAPSKELRQAREERDQAAADYHEAERSSKEWQTRELAKKVASASEELDSLEEKLRNGDTSRSKKGGKKLTNDELKLIEERKAEIKGELDNIRKREPLSPEEQRIYLEERLKAAEATEAALTEELRTGKAPEKFRRPKISSPELEAAQKRVNALRKQVADMRYGDGQAAFDKWAEDRITTLREQLANGRKQSAKRGFPATKANQDKLAEIKSLQDDLRRKEAPAKRLKTIEKRVKDKKLELARLEIEGYKEKGGKAPEIDTPEIALAKAELDKLEKIEAEWHANDGERDNAAYRKRLDAAEKVMNDRMAKGDYAPKEKKQIKLKPETVERLNRFREVQKKYYEMKLADRLARMNAGEKLLDLVGQALSVARTVLVGGEFSMVGRQGLLPATMAPHKVPKVIYEMLKSFTSEKSVTEADFQLKRRKNFANYERDKLFLSDVKDWTEKKVEEANTGRWARKLPFFKNFERANSTALNLLRANAYDVLYAYHTKLDGVEPTPEQGRNIARQVNIMSGRGEFGKFELARPVGSKILFSPGHTISRFQYALGGALWTGDAKSRIVLTAAYAQTIVCLSAMLGLAWYASGSNKWIELDPRSSDFLKIKIGQTRLDLMAGMSQAIVFMSRMASRQTKKGDKVVPLTGPTLKFRQQDLGDVAGGFARSKLNPFLGAGFNAWSEKDFSGNPSDVKTELNKLYKPITWSDIVDACQAQGLAKGVSLGIAAMLGAGVTTYQPRKPRPKPQKDPLSGAFR